MFEQSRFKSPFATPRHFASHSGSFSLTQILAAIGLLGMGIGIGVSLAPVFGRQNGKRAAPRRSAPVQEIDRWANEGGAVVTPAFQKTT